MIERYLSPGFRHEIRKEKAKAQIALERGN